jgi:hypothetical protein
MSILSTPSRNGWSMPLSVPKKHGDCMGSRKGLNDTTLDPLVCHFTIPLSIQFSRTCMIMFLTVVHISKTKKLQWNSEAVPPILVKLHSITLWR